MIIFTLATVYYLISCNKCGMHCLLAATIFIITFIFSIVPEDSPQNFTSQPTKTTVIFTWTKPATPNGIIIKYFLIVTNLDTLARYDYTVNVTANQVTVSQVTDGFSPYQNYTASVSASTIFGAGPVATTTGRTLPDGKII